MQNITIGRYSKDMSEQPSQVYSGWVEGTREDGSTWILFLNAEGSPQEYWGERQEDGGVVGDPVML